MKEFVIRVKRTWMLLILPILAFAYFIAVIVIIANQYDTRGITNEMLVFGGLGLFALVILVELPFLLRRKVRDAAPAVAQALEADPVVAEAEPYAPPAFAPPAPSGWDDERLTTTEVQQGLTVLEWSTPAKSRHKNAVYTKAYVPVSKQHVLRVETLAAEGADL